MYSPIVFRGRETAYYRAHYYPDEKTSAYEFLHEALQNVVRTQDTKTRILIVPNGSYRICGKIMAAAYSKLCPEKIKRIFIFGRMEQFFPYKCGLSDTDYLHSPLGRLLVDKEVNAELLKLGDFKYLELSMDVKERSIEMQLPFIAKVMENQTDKYKVIPIYVGALAHEQQQVISKRFVEYLKDPSNAFIFSTSLCHWGKIYGYETKAEGLTVLESIKSLDELAINAMRQLQFRPFDQFLLDTKAKVFDYQVINICICLVHRLLIEDLYSLVKLEEDKAIQAMKRTANFNVMGQAWSFPEVKEEDSCISFVSATISMDFEKYIPEEEPPSNPLSKLC